MMNLSHQVGEAIARAILQGGDPDGVLSGADPSSTCTRAHEAPCRFPNGQPGLAHQIELTFILAQTAAIEAARVGSAIAARIGTALEEDRVRLAGYLVIEGTVDALVIHMDSARGLAFVRLQITALTITEQ
ncbi:MAG: hypothetical protein U0975_16360 [Erythrobacter sp.]|nr:hypothetical protein [Erythrobacter sp.]MDZ4274235.1 hypothetical protein [Erythrobacter sp.]